MDSKRHPLYRKVALFWREEVAHQLGHPINPLILIQVTYDTGKAY